MLLQLFKKIKDNKITKDEDISTLIELTSYGLPYLKNEIQELSNHLAQLEKEETRLNNEIQRLENSVYANKALITATNGKLRGIEKTVARTSLLPQSLKKDPKYQQVMEIVDQKLKDRKPLLSYLAADT